MKRRQLAALTGPDDGPCASCRRSRTEIISAAGRSNICEFIPGRARAAELAPRPRRRCRHFAVLINTAAAAGALALVMPRVVSQIENERNMGR